MRSSPIIFPLMLLDDMAWKSATGQHHAGSSLCHLTLAQWAWRCTYWEVPEGWTWVRIGRNDMMCYSSVQMKLEDVSSQVHIGFSTSNVCPASLRMIPWCSSPWVFGFYMADDLEVALRSDGRGGSSIIDGPHRDQFGYKGAILSLSMSCWHLFDICRLEGVKIRSHQTPYHHIPSMIIHVWYISLHVPWKINHSCRLDGMGTISNQHPTGVKNPTWTFGCLSQERNKGHTNPDIRALHILWNYEFHFRLYIRRFFRGSLAKA